MAPRKGDSNELKKFLLAGKEFAVNDWVSRLFSLGSLRRKLPKQFNREQHAEILATIYDAHVDALSLPTEAGKTRKLRLRKSQKQYLEGLALHELQHMQLMLLDVLTAEAGRRYSAKPRKKEKTIALLNRRIHDLLLQASAKAAKDHKRAALRTESKYARLLDIANDAVFLLDYETGLFVEANKEACKLSGYSESELKEMGFNSLVSVFDLNLALERAKDAIENGAVRFDDLSIITKDKTDVPVDISASAVTLEGARYILAIMRDIKERKAFEKKLREDAERIQMVNEIACAISSADLDIEAVLESVLKSIAEVIRVEAGSILRREGNTLEFLVALGEKAEYVKPFRLKLGQGIAGWVAETGEDLIVRDVHTDPRYYGEVERATGFVTKSILAVPMKAGDKVVGVIELLNKIGGQFTKKDIELIDAISSFAAVSLDHARMYTECELAKERLTEAHTPVSSSQLAGVVAQEMKDPLGIIKNYVQILANRLSLSGTEHDELSVIFDEVDRIASITDQLLRFSEANSEKRKKTPLHLLIENAIEVMRDRLESAGITTRLNLESSLPEVSVIPNQMQMVFSNLIRLSMADMPDGGTLRLDMRKSDSSIFIEFSNTGIKHSKEEASELFLPSAVAKGLVPKGLGLYMVYNIIRQYGGDISIQARRGGGNAFRIILPMESLKAPGGVSQ